METYLSNRGYSFKKTGLRLSELNELKKSLTVKPFINENYGQKAIPFPVYCESTKKIYLPRYYGQSKYGIPTINKLYSGDSINITFSKSLKEKQQPIVNAFLKATETDGGGIISIPCGYGKTVIALYICAQLKVKTLVVVHKEFLLNQWKERIKEFLPDAKIGRLQSNVIYVEGYDIVIGMLQSISMIEYEPDIFSKFGFVIYDECHHLGAETFSKALLKTGFKYTLGLSATPKRLDGLSKIFEWSLGGIVYSIKKRDDSNVLVNVLNYECDESYNGGDEEYSKVILNFKKQPNSARMINNICAFKPRTHKIIEEIMECLKEGRKILLLSDRREHLKTILELLETKSDKYTYGYYLGGMKEKDLQETETKNVILGTFSMASEGFDCKYPLDTIILASPKSNIEQAIGRILRQDEKDRKFVPLVIDIVDNFSLFAKQKIKRINFYKKNNYLIESYDSNNNKLDINYYENTKSNSKSATKSKKYKQIDFDFIDDE
jgi:superfamily II DNA or RNA helicase